MPLHTTRHSDKRHAYRHTDTQTPRNIADYRAQTHTDTLTKHSKTLTRSDYRPHIDTDIYSE